MLNGDAFVEFRSSFDDGTPVSHLDAVRLVNAQTDTINASLGSLLRVESGRRQSVVHLLEQCVILCSEIIPSSNARSRKRFRRIRRAVERARRLVHADSS
jgi:hypothetical protein